MCDYLSLNQRVALENWIVQLAEEYTRRWCKQFESEEEAYAAYLACKLDTIGTPAVVEAVASGSG